MFKFKTFSCRQKFKKRTDEEKNKKLHDTYLIFKLDTKLNTKKEKKRQLPQ